MADIDGAANEEALRQLKLTAVGSERVIDLAAPGTDTLLICFAQETQAGIAPVEDVARALYPSARRLAVAHVVDLRKVPGILRKVAEAILGGEHKKAVSELPEGAAPAYYVVILPDWDGAAVSALGLEDASKTMGLALLDKGGRVVWRYQGPEPAEALRERLSSQPL